MDKPTNQEPEMTWDDIMALDESALNTAIDFHVYRYSWESVARDSLDGWWDSWWRCQERPGGSTTYSSVPHFHHTASWERTMALALRFDVTAAPILDYDQGTTIKEPREWVAYCGVEKEGEIHGLSPDYPQSIRIAICRLALYANSMIMFPGQERRRG